MATITISGLTIPNFHYSGTTFTVRIFSDKSWIAQDGSAVPARGDNNAFYKEYTLTVVGTDATLPTVILLSHTDAPNEKNAQYSAYIYVDGIEKDMFLANTLGAFQVPDAPTSTTWANLEQYNIRNKNQRYYKDDNTYSRLQIDQKIAAIPSQGIPILNSSNTSVPLITAVDIGQNITNLNATAGNLEAQAFSNASGAYQGAIGVKNIGSGATAGGDFFIATRPAGSSTLKEWLRVSSAGTVTFDTSGSLGIQTTQTDMSSWVLSKFRLTGGLNFTTDRYLMAIQPYALVSAPGAYEQCGILVQAKTRDPSVGGDKDMVGIDTRSQIVDANMQGRAWGIATQATAEVGSDGFLVGGEFFAGGGSDQPLVDTTTSKYTIHLVGANGITAGIKFTGPGFHKMIYANPADILGTHANDGFIELLNTWKVAKDGSTAIGNGLPMGIFNIASNTGTAASWSYVYGNVGAANPSSLFSTGLAIGWNRSGGSGETNLVFGTGSGTAPRLEIGEWNGTVYSPVMVARAGGKVGVGITNPLGVFHVSNNVGDASAWSYIYGNVGAANPSALFTSGLMIGWNRSGGGGETNLVFGTGTGGAPNLEIGAWDGATYALAMAVTSGANVGIGTTTFGTSAAKVLALFNGTEPSTSPIDTVQLFSVDLSAGNATLGLRTETAVTVAAAGASDAYLNIRHNGTTYKLLLHT